MQYELILQDELDNSYKCKYISSDNTDKCALCILELMHITNNILTYGTKLYFYDTHNDVYYMYIIYNIYYINNVSMTCKLYYGGSESSNKQLFAYMIPDNTNNKNPLWYICSNLILNPIFDYEMCKIFNENDQYIYVILKKNYIIPNTYIIRRPYKKELTFFKNQTNFSVIDIVPNDFSKTKYGSKLFHNWCKLLNFSQELIIFDNNNSQIQIKNNNQKDVQEDIQDIVQEDVQEDVQDNVQDNVQDIVHEDVQENVHEDVHEDVQENVHEDVQEDVQKDVQEVIQEKIVQKYYEVIVQKYNQVIFQEDVQENIQDDSSIQTLDENEIENININMIKNNISDSTTSSLTDNEDLSEEIIEKDTFYDDIVEIDNNLDNCIIGKNIITMPYNNDLFKQEKISNKNKKSNIITKTNNKIKVFSKIIKDSSNNNDVFLEVLSKFDEFYEKNIIKNLIEKDKIYEKYTSILDNYDKKLIEYKVEVILEHILNTFKTHLPSIVIDEKCIYDTIQSDMKKMAEKLMNKTDEKFLIPFIKPFKLIFKNAFNNIDPMKRKVLLIYYSLSEKKDDLTSFLGMVPSILFQDNDGHITTTGFIQEEKVTIFHMGYMYNLFNNYILKLLFKNKQNVINIDFKDVLIKLLYQYFSCYIVHNDLTEIMIVRNNIYEHYIELIQCHLQFLYPKFEFDINCDYTKLNTIKEQYNRFMLKYRIMSSLLLKGLDENKYYIIAGFMSKLLNSYYYCPNTGKIVNYINDDDLNLHKYFEDLIKKEFLNAFKNLDNLDNLYNIKK